MNKLETLLETLSRIPGLGFMGHYAKDVRGARHMVRDTRERAEEVAESASNVKGAAGMEKENQAAAAAGAPPKRPEKVTRDIRAKSRGRGGDGLEEPVVKKPKRKPAIGTEKRGDVRDVSPRRDRGRSLRKRKEGF